MSSSELFPVSFMRRSGSRRAPELLKTRGVSLEAFPISGSVVLDHPEFPEHWHRFVEIVIVQAGTATHVVNGQAIPLLAGHAFVLPPSFKHAYRDTVGLKLINICYDPGRLGFDEAELNDLPGYAALFHVEPRLRSCGTPRHLLQLPTAALCQIENLALRIIHESRKQPKGFRAMSRGLLLQLITELSRLYDRPHAATGSMVHRLAGAIQYLESEFSGQIDFDELPRRFHFSKRNFYRLFTSVTGEAPLAYVRKCRLKEAARRLLETDQSVTEIAFAVGFQNSSHFSHAFQKLFHRSPSEYRRKA